MAIKQQILEGAALVATGGCGYGVTMLMVEAVGNGGGGQVEGLGGVGKGERNGMIVGEILCLFLLRKLPILLVPLSFSPLHG